ncbi:MAG: M20 family metallopeptidase [Lachnospiraceae bacterium]|nr:M20 family metallopeptidase [Lachnospiraceae bacterium]
MTDYKLSVQQRVDEILPRLIALSDDIWSHPEYNFQEFHACQAMSTALREQGFHVETGAGGVETSVKAVYDSGKPGPNIGIFGEFDAVPGMGHACGHNLMCAIAVGAGTAIKSVSDELGGKVTVLGCPAEEGGGGKIMMLENGAFRELDFGMLFHPATQTVVHDRSYSKTTLTIHFTGKKTHAAATPECGINALNPMIELFNMVAAMRLELTERGNIFGVITDGGQDPNYIPEHTSAQFVIRSFSSRQRKNLLDRFLGICRHLSEIYGTPFSYTIDGLTYENIMNNPIIEKLLEENLTELGEEVLPREAIVDIGSTDMGNVTHEVPALQSYIKVFCDPIPRNHTIEFQNAVGGPAGHLTIANAAKAMAMTAVDILTHPAYLEEIQKAFQDEKARYE